MPFVIECSDLPQIFSDEQFSYSFLVDLYPASTNAHRRYLDARLTVDDVVIPIETFSYDDDDNEIGAKLTATLARLSDKSAFTRTASIKFELGEKLAGVWVWTTMFQDARLQALGNNLAQKDATPNDKVTIVAVPLLQQRLEITPLGHVSLYDPAKLTLVEGDFLSVPDIDGVEHLVTLVPTADLSTWDIFDYVAAQCGFAGFISNVPDFPIRRIDFTAGEPFWNAVAGLIGVFKPQLDIDADDNLVIREGTNDLLPDSTAAVALAVDRLTQLDDSRNIERFKGTLLTYQEQGLGWDYWLFDIVNDDHYRDNVAGRDPFSRRETWIQKFYRRSFPNTPVKELRRIERKWVSFVANEVAASSETLNYTSLGLLSGREKRVHAKAKVPASWSTFQAELPGPGTISTFDGGESAYTSASDDTFSNDYVLIRTERENILYNAHPYEPDQVYMSYRENEQKGLITRDADNPQLDQDFDQPLETAQRSGNLAEGQGSYWGTTGYGSEQQIPTRNRGVIIRTSEADSLNADSGEALLPKDYEDPRQGDIGISVIQHIQKQVYVFDEADSTATRILPLNAGEAPIAIARPLAVRYNRAQYYPGNASMGIPGFDLSLTRGRAIAPSDRAGTTYGTYKITGRTISGDGGKYTTVLRGHQIGSAEVVASESDQINDVASVSLESGQSKIITIKVQCFNGMFLSGEVVSDLTVEARIGHSGAFTNIEVDDIDLVAYDGTTQDVEVKITAPTVTSHYIRAFTLTVGPLTNTEDMYYGADAMTYLGEQMTYTN